MQDLLQALEPADYRFIVELIEGPLNVTDDDRLHAMLARVEADNTEENRAAMSEQIESSARYLGSSEILYWTRSLMGQSPGAPWSGILRDVAGQLKVRDAVEGLGTDREQVRAIVEAYATQQFSDLSTEEQQQMLESLGVEQDKAAAFLKRSAGVFALPLLIETFNVVVVQGLIKQVIFGTIARVIGSQLATRLFTFLAGRMPWWVSWVGPAAWSLSIGWTAIDLQGPARRKTIPLVLYLGVCALRIDGVSVDAEQA